MVKRLEAQHPRSSVKDMIAKIRKAFYFSAAAPTNLNAIDKVLKALGINQWDLLIPGSSDVKPLPRHEAEKFSKASKQNWRGEGIGLIDLGHVFSALDAFYNPRPSWKARTLFGFHDSVGPASWSGDVGSVLTAYFSQYKSGEKFNQRVVDVYTRYASNEDVIGDVDGVAMGVLYKGKGMKLSRMLERYFVKEKEFKTQRFSAFAISQIGGKNLGSAKVRQSLKKDISLFARGYWKKSKSGFTSIFTRNYPWTEANVERVVDLFISQLQKMQAQETVWRRNPSARILD